MSMTMDTKRDAELDDRPSQTRILEPDSGSSWWVLEVD